jgi:hypothetical protein
MVHGKKENNHSAIFSRRKYFMSLEGPPPGDGFFSNFHWVLGHIIYAVEHNYTPVIDMKNYPTFFNEKEIFDGTLNAWEYYFKQPTKYPLEEVYNAKNVILGQGVYFDDIVPYGCFDPDRVEIASNNIQKYIQFNEKTRDVINEKTHELFSQKKNVLGVHDRGSDYRTHLAKGHNKVPELDDLINKTKYLFSKWNMEWIYLSSEENLAVDKFYEIFGDKLLVTESKRIKNYKPENGYTSEVNFKREHDNYLKSLECLIDIYLLSKCDAIICSKVNGAQAAFEFNGNKYQNKYIFELGIQ